MPFLQEHRQLRADAILVPRRVRAGDMHSRSPFRRTLIHRPLVGAGERVSSRSQGHLRRRDREAEESSPCLHARSPPLRFLNRPSAPPNGLEAHRRRPRLQSAVGVLCSALVGRLWITFFTSIIYQYYTGEYSFFLFAFDPVWISPVSKGDPKRTHSAFMNYRSPK